MKNKNLEFKIISAIVIFLFAFNTSFAILNWSRFIETYNIADIICFIMNIWGFIYISGITIEIFKAFFTKTKTNETYI